MIESESSDEEMVEEPETKPVKKSVKKEKPELGKGDADSSSEEDESDEEPVAQTAKERKAANDKLKRDLEQE